MEDDAIIGNETNHFWRRCKDDDERRDKYLAAQKIYNNKPYTCEDCKDTIKIGGKIIHSKSKKHLKK